MRAPVQRLSGEQLYLSTLFACAQMLRSGTTTCLDHYFASPALPYAGMEHEVRAMEEVGIRAAVAYILADLPWEDTLPLDEAELARVQAAAPTGSPPQETAQSLDAYEGFLSEFGQRRPRISCLVGPSAVHRLSDGLFQGCRAWPTVPASACTCTVARPRRTPCSARLHFGTTLVGRLEALGVLRDDVSMAHCVWLTDPRAETWWPGAGATVVHNPASNLKLGSGVARVRAMLERGVHVALGTDGPCCERPPEHVRGAALGGHCCIRRNQVDYRAWPSALQVASHGHYRERTCLRPGARGRLAGGWQTRRPSAAQPRLLPSGRRQQPARPVRLLRERRVDRARHRERGSSSCATAS